MSRCLSDNALARVTAELGTTSQQSHLTSCARCALRHHRLRSGLSTIRQVLRTTDEPRRREAPSRLRRVAGVAALSAVAVAALLLIELTAWKALQPEPDMASAEQIETALADVTAALFSVEGEPARFVSEGRTEAALLRDGDASAECDTPPGVAPALCPESVLGVEDTTDPGDAESMDPPEHEMEAMDHNTSDAARADQGG